MTYMRNLSHFARNRLFDVSWWDLHLLKELLYNEPLGIAKITIRHGNSQIYRKKLAITKPRYIESLPSVP